MGVAVSYVLHDLAALADARRFHSPFTGLQHATGSLQARLWDSAKEGLDSPSGVVCGSAVATRAKISSRRANEGRAPSRYRKLGEESTAHERSSQ